MGGMGSGYGSFVGPNTGSCNLPRREGLGCKTKSDGR